MSDCEPLLAWNDLVRRIAIEIAIAQPGCDHGLLPLNCLLMEMEERHAANPAPPAFAASIAAARTALDKVFDSSATFEAASLQWFYDWQEWMQTAMETWEARQATPDFPERLQPTFSSAGTEPKSSPPTAGATMEDEPLLVELDADAELLSEFITESYEHLDTIERSVLVLEETPDDADTLNAIFRGFHTFKGGSGLLKLTPIQNLAHDLESLLDALRQRKLGVTSDIITLILTGSDALKQFIIAIERQLQGKEPRTPILVPTATLRAQARAALSAGEEDLGTGRQGEMGNVPSSQCPPIPPSPLPQVPELRRSAASYVKVDTSKLDSLVDMVGELVIAQSQVSQDPTLLSIESRLLASNLAQVGRITRELQRTAMSLRMVPIRQTFQKMTRLVRDSSARLGKQIELTMSGEDTELDRIIVEEISDPLIHMVRNSVDHGIEKPDVRLERGKPARGTVHLAACHEGGNIVIAIKDDGGGLNTERILVKAIAQEIVPPDAQLSEKEIFALIFAPGFSTAETVTDISGRGVGMDVVRRNIDKMRGKIDIASTPGQGSTFTISLPLTLAIIDGFIVGVGGERFILPTLSVRESFRPTREMISTVHERGEMVNVRGHLSPLLRLSEYFNIPAQATHPTQGIVVVIEAGGSDRCLLVDELIGKQEVVIKSLGETFQNNRALAGAAILGDGRVGLILEVNSLVRPPREPLARAA